MFGWNIINIQFNENVRLLPYIELKMYHIVSLSRLLSPLSLYLIIDSRQNIQWMEILSQILWYVTMFICQCLQLYSVSLPFLKKQENRNIFVEDIEIVFPEVFMLNCTCLRWLTVSQDYKLSKNLIKAIL